MNNSPTSLAKNLLTNKEEMLAYIKSHPEDFNELLALSLADKQPYSWRAAWLLWKIMKKNDERIQPQVTTIVKKLLSFGDSQQRNLINILLKMEVEEDNEALLFDSCITIWKDLSKQSSVRFKALEVMVKMTKCYPELQNELESLTDKAFMDPLSAGIRKSALKMINS